MVYQRGPGLPFWDPGGGRELAFELLWVPYGPSVPPESFLEDFGGHCGVNLSPKSVNCSVDFQCVFGMFVGGVLEWVWGCFR